MYMYVSLSNNGNFLEVQVEYVGDRVAEVHWVDFDLN